MKERLRFVDVYKRQVLHVHVFLVAPLGTRHVAEPGADQHQGGVAVRECPYPVSYTHLDVYKRQLCGSNSTSVCHKKQEKPTPESLLLINVF